jgi:hypothetical protein
MKTRYRTARIAPTRKNHSDPQIIPSPVLSRKPEVAVAITPIENPRDQYLF